MNNIKIKRKKMYIEHFTYILFVCFLFYFYIIYNKWGIFIVTQKNNRRSNLIQSNILKYISKWKILTDAATIYVQL